MCSLLGQLRLIDDVNLAPNAVHCTAPLDVMKGRCVDLAPNAVHSSQYTL
jgi:hypothetical protein